MEKSGRTPVSQVDFILEDHGSILFLHPQNQSAEDWINAYVSQEGYQPSWPSVLMERRYAQALVEGVQSEGFTVASGIALRQAVSR
jgi:hypothetical protein